MRGVIAKVNEDSAILVDEDKKQYSFGLDVCMGFDDFPEVGEKVEFDLDGGEIFFVELAKVKSESVESASPVKSKVKKKTKDNLKEKKSENSQKSKPGKKEKNKKVKLAVNIPLDYSIEDSLDIYFDNIVSSIYEYEAEFDESETLDYILMKRFLTTAYNNLKDMDSTFMDDYVLELKYDLKIIENVYQKFLKKNSVPEIAFDTVFLSKQGSYVSYEKKLELNTGELMSAESTMKSIEHRIKDLTREIELATVSKHAEAKELDLKKLNRFYVDSIHQAGTLKEENAIILEALEKFKNSYRQTFTEMYEEEAKKYNDYIREQLNGYAYEFDKKMWESAEKSASIRSFFKRANIEEDYSSRTFLKYFIKSLDDTKLSNEHKRLFAMLEYLDSRAKLRVLVVSENFKDSDRIKHTIRSFDKDFSIEVSDKPRSSYYRRDLGKLDIVIVDLHIKNPTIFEFVDMMEKRIKQSKGSAIICVSSSKFKKDNLVLLKKRKIGTLLSTALSDEAFEDRLIDIIESLDE